MAGSIDPHRFSYRRNAAVPDFDDSRPVAFMDAGCALCCFGARLISKMDRSGDIRICPVQSPLGHAVLQHYAVDPDDPESWLYLEGGAAYTGLDAMIRIALYTDRAPVLAHVAARLPVGLREWIYRRIARNRYWFGRSDLCEIPSPDLQARLIK